MERETAVYKKDEFIETAVKRGYATAGTCKVWMDNNPKLLYSEDDLYEVYRFQERYKPTDDPFGGFLQRPARKTGEEYQQLKREYWLAGEDYPKKKRKEDKDLI